MGNRALVIFYDERRISPTVYLHWNGGKVPELLGDLAEYMKGRYGDAERTFMRAASSAAAGALIFTGCTPA